MRRFAAALLASLLPLLALAQQPAMRAQVLIVESLADFERWAEHGATRPYAADLREVPVGKPVHFPIVVTGLQASATDVNLVADIEFFGPGGNSLGVIQQCCRFASRAGSPVKVAVLGNAATLVFGANDMRGTYSVSASVSDGTRRIAVREDFRFAGPPEAARAPLPAPATAPAPARAPAPAPAPAKAPPPRLRMDVPEKNPGADADKRSCLDLPTAAEVIKCAEKKK
jgi:hypothetical protein